MAGKMLVINPAPKKKRRRGRSKLPAGLARYMAKKKRGRKGRKSRARPNPRLRELFTRKSLKSNVLEPVMAAGIGGAAAVALDVALAYIPLPTAIADSKLAKNGARLLGAILLGYGAGRVLGKERGRMVTIGALTVAAFNLVRDGVKSILPEELRAKVKGLGGLEDLIDYELPGVGAFEYNGQPVRGSLRGNPNLGLIEANSPSLGGTFDPAFDGAFGVIEDN